ncbi:DUF262 domain-containing protein [Nostoc sp. FACHB-145]|uniref:GmrSD restriction endonuclease domain-containing protein n=1 Tax=Nostoc sp. FACHB-145 TaxID=2692836 RepID=UPI0016857F3A|nr:DUF262 domain-containing protein [Nostoc sp. FACHB-145]MBD2467867.1 DUF262 domain-containing protein [Nostoc sp. FACHB-145]
MKNQKETIRKMVTYLNNEEKDGGFWLPNIQRPFVWSEEQIERLFDSIMREYPISTLLVWRTNAKIKCRKFIDHYKQSLKLFDFYVTENNQVKLLVLDGQQRLQAMFIGLKGSYEKKELFFNVLSGDLVAPEDIRYYFKFLNSDIAKFPWIKFKDIVFSYETFDEIAETIIDNSGAELTKDDKKRIRKNIARTVGQFCTVDFVMYQELDSVDSPEVYQEDDVVEIFIRANSGGTQLGKSDLLFSLLTSSWDDADEELEDLIDELNRSGYSFTRDFILKTCITLLDKGAQYDVNKFRDGVTREEIIKNWDNIANAIKDIKDFLFGKTFLQTDKAVPSYLALIPIIYFRYHYPKKWSSIQHLDTYILRTLLTGAFSGNPDKLIDKLTKKIKETEEFDVKHLFGVIRADGRNLEITESNILGQHYSSKYIHIYFNLWYQRFDYHPAYYANLPQIDHIFPQSVLRKIKTINPNTGRKDILKYLQFDRDQIANCMLLTAKENGAGGKKDILPEQWFSGKDDSYLDLHLIPKERELWKLDNYQQFIEARKKLILEKFSFMIQTNV